ncbi:Uncharacterized protein GNX_3426 [Leptospira interrogans serovar Canicola]|nr:Uncharacterized protein GNX_3426 [Leptospira interrogans serovar Canicola]
MRRIKIGLILKCKKNRGKNLWKKENQRRQLNFAIGAAKSLREQADSILLKVEKEFKELASKGAQDQSEVAKNLRKYIEDALHSVEGVAGQVNSKVEEVKSKVNQGVSSTKVPLNGSKGKAETAGKH